MAEIRNAKVLWGGGIVSCTTNNTAEYLSADDKRIKYLSGDTSNPGLLLSAQTISEETVLRAKTNAKNNTDADAFVFDNGMVYVYKTPCTSKMKCKYLTGANDSVKLFSNNAYIWFMSLEDDKFTVTCDYNDFNSSGGTNFVRMPNNTRDTNTSNYFRFKEKGTAEYHFTQKGINLGQTPAGMFSGCTRLVSCSVPCEMRIISRNTFSGCSILTSYTENPNFITEIGENAFSKCTNLNTLLIPKYAKLGNSSFNSCTGATTLKWHGVSGGTSGTTVKCNMSSIPDYAFYNCYNLKDTELDNNTVYDSLVIPSGITSIGQSAFYHSYDTGDRKYTNIYFNGIETIGTEAFYCNEERPETGISLVYGFETVETVGDRAFYNNCYLNNLVKGKTGTTCGTENVNSLGEYAFYRCGIDEFIFGDGLTEIKMGAFDGCMGLSSVPGINHIKTIGESAFYQCGLTSITLSSIETIENYAFESCGSLSNVTIGNNAESIGIKAFYNCQALTSVTIPDSVTYLGWSAFEGCSSLSRAIIGNGITTIDSDTFSDCTSLSSVTIGSSVINIGSWAFDNCSSLTSITFPYSVTSIGKYAFFNCNSLTSVAIPSGITSIDNNAFEYCSGLTSVTIESGDTTIEIGENAFYNCQNLSDVYIKRDSPDKVDLDGSSFGNNHSNFTIWVPNDSLNSFTSAWPNYNISGMTF